MTEDAIKSLKTFAYKFVTFVPAISSKGIGGSFQANYAPDQRLEFAKEIISRFALIAGDDNGEDSAGRAKARRQTPGEIVSFACDTAEKAFEEFEKRGWLMPLPDYQELIVATCENINLK
jgi:hypothetical protein